MNKRKQKQAKIAIEVVLAAASLVVAVASLIATIILTNISVKNYDARWATLAKSSDEVFVSFDTNDLYGFADVIADAGTVKYGLYQLSGRVGTIYTYTIYYKRSDKTDYKYSYKIDGILANGENGKVGLIKLVSSSTAQKYNIKIERNNTGKAATVVFDWGIY